MPELMSSKISEERIKINITFLKTRISRFFLHYIKIIKTDKFLFRTRNMGCKKKYFAVERNGNIPSLKRNL